MLLQFQKGDIVRHLGLLDLQRTMQRALRRSGLPIAYSNGFNPHIVMSFASALSSGIPGDAELLDVSLNGEATAEECMAAKNRVLPPALQVSRVRMVDDRFPKVSAALRQAEYTITLRGGGACAIASALPAFLAQKEIMALRKTKRSENDGQHPPDDPCADGADGRREKHGGTDSSRLLCGGRDAQAGFASGVTVHVRGCAAGALRNSPNLPAWRKGRPERAAD